MATPKKRVLASGVRWTAQYRDARGHQRSAGTFATKRAATLAIQAAEALERSGRGVAATRPTGACGSPST